MIWTWETFFYNVFCSFIASLIFIFGKVVRKTIKDIGGTMPEDLPTAENIKKLENKNKKQLLNNENE